MMPLTIEGQTVKVQGDITYDNAAALFESGRAYFKKAGDWTVDLSTVEKLDSAALAVLIEWLKLAKQHQTKINFVHLPEHLLNLAKLCDVEDVLVHEFNTTTD